MRHLPSFWPYALFLRSISTQAKFSTLLTFLVLIFQNVVFSMEIPISIPQLGEEQSSFKGINEKILDQFKEMMQERNAAFDRIKINPEHCERNKKDCYMENLLYNLALLKDEDDFSNYHFETIHNKSEIGIIFTKIMEEYKKFNYPINRFATGPYDIRQIKNKLKCNYIGLPICVISSIGFFILIGFSIDKCIQYNRNCSSQITSTCFPIGDFCIAGISVGAIGEIAFLMFSIRYIIQIIYNRKALRERYLTNERINNYIHNEHDDDKITECDQICISNPEIKRLFEEKLSLVSEF